MHQILAFVIYAISLFIGMLQNVMDPTKIWPRADDTMGDDCGSISLKSLPANASQLMSSAEFPWTTLLVYEGSPTSFSCGGVLVNRRYVLTTTECLRYANVTGVRLGVFNLTSAMDCVLDTSRSLTNCKDGSMIVGIEKTIIHPNASQPFYLKKDSSTIGLIRLKKSNLSPWIKPICLPGATQLKNDKHFVAGWGVNTGLGPSKRSIKHASRVIRLSNDLCFGSPVPIFGDGFCMSPEICQNGWIGNQGGSLMALDDKSKATVVGLIVGLQEGCTEYKNDVQSQKESSALYVDVLKHINWIKEVIKNEFE